VQKAAVDRAKVDPSEIGQIIGGCVSQVGEQTFNIARTAWLAQGLPLEVAATTIDSQCGSSQQATSLAAVSSAPASRTWSRVRRRDDDARPARLGHGRRQPAAASYRSHYAFASQFQGAEMIAKEFGITRQDTDRFGLQSQEKAIVAWEQGRYAREVVPIDAPALGEDGKPTGETPHGREGRGAAADVDGEARVAEARRGGRRAHRGHVVAGVGRRVGGAARVGRPREALGLKPRARIVTTTLVGVDPVTMLKGRSPRRRRCSRRRASRSTTWTRSR
jgi:acetyl-CoA C-acetyltransferase